MDQSLLSEPPSVRIGDSISGPTWNTQPSVGTWLHSTTFEVDAADGKTFWSMPALDRLPLKSELVSHRPSDGVDGIDMSTLHKNFKELPIVGINRLHSLLLCQPPRRSGTRCWGCRADFKTRGELFIHLRKHSLLKKECCMVTSAERRFWSNLSPDDFPQTAQAATMLGAGPRFFPGAVLWLDSARFTKNETARRIDCLSSLEPLQFALIKTALVAWFDGIALTEDIERLFKHMKGKVHRVVLELATERMNQLEVATWSSRPLSDKNPGVYAVLRISLKHLRHLCWDSSAAPSGFNKMVLEFIRRAQDRKILENCSKLARFIPIILEDASRSLDSPNLSQANVFAIFRCFCPRQGSRFLVSEFCKDATARVLDQAASHALACEDEHLKSEAMALVVQAVAARNQELNKILPASADQLLLAATLTPGPTVDICSMNEALRDILQNASLERVIPLLPPLIGATLQLLCGRYPIPFTQLESLKKFLAAAQNQPGPPWTLDAVEREGLPPLGPSLLLPENLDGQVLFACSPVSSAQYEAGLRALSAVLTAAPRCAAELLDMLLKPAVFCDARVSVRIGDMRCRGTVIVVAEKVELVMDDASQYSTVAEDCEHEFLALSVLVHVALGLQEETLGPLGEPVLTDRRYVFPVELKHRAQLAVSQLVSVSPVRVGALLSSVQELLPRAADGSESNQAMLRSLIIALLSCNPMDSRMRTWLSTDGVALVYMCEGVLEAASHDASRTAVREQLLLLLTADFDLVTRVATLVLNPADGIGIRALKVVVKLLREFHADEGALVDFMSSFVQALAMPEQMRPTSLPIIPGAATLAGIFRCLSQRHTNLLNEFVEQEGIVPKVVDMLYTYHDPNTRSTRGLGDVIELAHALLGPEDEEYTWRLDRFTNWGITEEQLEPPGRERNRAPNLVLQVGEDVLRSSLEQILRAQVGSLQLRKFKVKFTDGIGEGDGLRRAFLARAGAELCNMRLNLLIPAERGYFQLSPVPGLLGSQDLRENTKDWCRLLGRLLGIAVIHDEPMGLFLVPSLCKCLVGDRPDFSDLHYVCASWHRSLSTLYRGAPGTIALERLTSDQVDDILDGKPAECMSKPAFVFDALVSSVENAGEDKLELAELLLRSAATKEQQDKAVSAATEVLPFGSTAEQQGLLAAAHCLPHSAEVDQFIALVHSFLGTEPKSPEHESPEQESPEQESPEQESPEQESPEKALVPSVVVPSALGLERLTSVVTGDGISAGELLNSKNIEQFTQAVTQKLLWANLQPHLGHMCEEFHKVVSFANQTRTWEEVQRIVAGAPVNVSLWRRVTRYVGHSPDSPTVTWWWELLEKGGELYQQRVFTFATGYASMPPGGIKFTMELDADADRLPSARTCTSTLRMPAYPTSAILSEKLAWALTAEGFQFV